MTPRIDDIRGDDEYLDALGARQGGNDDLSELFGDWLSYVDESTGDFSVVSADHAAGRYSRSHPATKPVRRLAVGVGLAATTLSISSVAAAVSGTSVPVLRELGNVSRVFSGQRAMPDPQAQAPASSSTTSNGGTTDTTSDETDGADSTTDAPTSTEAPSGSAAPKRHSASADPTSPVNLPGTTHSPARSTTLSPSSSHGSSRNPRHPSSKPPRSSSSSSSSSTRSAPTSPSSSPSSSRTSTTAPTSKPPTPTSSPTSKSSSAPPTTRPPRPTAPSSSATHSHPATRPGAPVSTQGN